MGIKNFLQKVKETTMSREARVEEACRKAVPKELAGMLLAGGTGEAERVVESLAALTGQEAQKPTVELCTELLGVYVRTVRGALFDDVPLHDLRAELLRRYESFLKAGNIERVVTFCILHAGDGTFFMTADDAEEQLAAMAESLRG